MCVCVRAIPFLGKITSGACALSDVCVYIYTGERYICTSIRGYTVTYVLAVTMCAVYTEKKRKKKKQKKAQHMHMRCSNSRNCFVGEYKKETRKNVWNEVKCLRASIKFKATPPRWRTIPSSLDPSYARLSTFLLKWFRLQLQTGNKIEKVLTYLGDETLGDPFFLLSTIIPIERVELIRGQYNPVVWHTLRSFWIDPARASYEREIE